MALVHKIVSASDWNAAVAEGVFKGAGIDLKDGYIHLSTSSQARETARLWFAGVRGLLLVSFNAASLGDDLKYEASRGGDLFPHFYGVLHVAQAVSVHPLNTGADGLHVFPEFVQ